MFLGPPDVLTSLGFLAAGAALVLFVLFLATAAGVLVRVSPANRRMEPAQVWLNLVPLLNLVWAVVTVERVGESLRNEFRARGLDERGETFGKTAGLTALVLFAAAVIPHAYVITWPFGIVYMAVYWLQLTGYARRLRAHKARPYTPPADEGW
jgi:hypothetical protein